ncbi:glycosyltransferase family 4 protein [Magnetospira sp. QH-2]|uniref:glycosyltransferase family 4 protein n=1 Tax=Magnetospira sp. (strain QH-2) TaxID=1288970 RepID=UPI0003E80A9A|nr:glycosyltransferase family 4 protein [Magnetospira sp. QH-2]CCQ72405.1 putative GT4 : distantly related to UDP-Glc: tetrahydrobiopterin a-glucosyltransferase [Magnetospira sp. QH-2]
MMDSCADDTSKRLLPTDTSLKVLQIATLNRPIQQDLCYGPIENVIYNLDKGLSELGHRSIVACPGDSCIVGEKHTTIENGFAEYCSTKSRAKLEFMGRHMSGAMHRAQRGDIDIVHMHDPVMMMQAFEGLLHTPVPIVMTLHVPADEKGDFELWNESLPTSTNAYFVPISDYQRKQHRGLVNMQEVIHHGIDLSNFTFEADPGPLDYLFSIGRITEDKGQDTAIEIAKSTGTQLILAGNTQNKRKDRAFFKKLEKSIDLVVDASAPLYGDAYYTKVMKPILESGKQIIYIGEVGSAQKNMWYGHAGATLFPIRWGEPFGLVLIESMACGTPVLAFDRGSVPEIIAHRKTGFVSGSMQEMLAAVGTRRQIDRSACRRHVQNNFSITSMARKYSELYRRIIDERYACPKTSP